MEAALRMPMTGIGIVVPWKRILHGLLLAVCCLSLYICGMYKVYSCEELTSGKVIEYQTVGLHVGIYSADALSSVKNIAANPVPELPVEIGEGMEVLHTVPEPAVLEADVDEIHSESEGEISGTLTRPSVVDVEETGEAGNEWIEVSGFICDDNGYIVDYTDAVITVDGILVIPSDDRCRGIAKGALDGLASDITEIYIPSNICEIDPSVFDDYSSLFYIEVAGDNSFYYSSNGVLYARSGKMIAYPRGRQAESMNGE